MLIEREPLQQLPTDTQPAQQQALDPLPSSSVASWAYTHTQQLAQTPWVTSASMQSPRWSPQGVLDVHTSPHQCPRHRAHVCTQPRLTSTSIPGSLAAYPSSQLVPLDIRSLSHTDTRTQTGSSCWHHRCPDACDVPSYPSSWHLLPVHAGTR